VYRARRTATTRKLSATRGPVDPASRSLRERLKIRKARWSRGRTLDGTDEALPCKLTQSAAKAGQSAALASPSVVGQLT
jgi:hypothetical protein